MRKCKFIERERLNKKNILEFLKHFYHIINFFLDHSVYFILLYNYLQNYAINKYHERFKHLFFKLIYLRQENDIKKQIMSLFL